MSESAAPAGVLACPFCGAPVEAGDLFCETCGRSLTGDPEATVPASADAARVTAHPSSDSMPTAPADAPRLASPCVNCGAPADAIDPDGYCTVCGRRQPSVRDHQESDLGWAAAVSDRGLHHSRNEDAYFLAVAPTGGVVAVVCDGVSASVQPDAASQAAADAAGAVLIDIPPTEDLAAATAEAMATAQKAVAALPWAGTDDLASPSCTFVSAAYRDDQVAIGWAGDSRAYWIGEAGVRQLTVDNSWAEAQVTAGLMTELEADADPRSHAITRWLGADAPQEEPQTLSFPVDAPGRLLVCSDGLWNYAPTEDHMADLVGPGATTSPIELARAVTTFALDAGGHDNITVVVIDLPPAPAAAEKGTRDDIHR